MISSSGAVLAKPTSKRTWSLPLPVQPWATAVPLCSLAASAMCLTISGREIAETSGYSFMYRPLALIVGRQYSLANSSRASASARSAPADGLHVLAALAQVDGHGDDLSV